MTILVNLSDERGSGRFDIPTAKTFKRKCVIETVGFLAA